MPRVSALLLVAMASVLLLETPVRGQSADAGETKRIEELIAELGDEDSRAVRRDAARALAAMGAKAVPALVAALSDTRWYVRSSAAHALGLIGLEATPAVPNLVAANADQDSDVRKTAKHALNRIGSSLRAKGTVLWWIIPRVYWKELTALLLLLFAWLALMARFPRHRPTSTLKHLALMALTAVVPVALACSAVSYAITRWWAEGFLPHTLTVVPFPVAAVLSTALVCTLPAVWVCQRKTVAVEA